MIGSAGAERHFVIKRTFFGSQCYARYVARVISRAIYRVSLDILNIYHLQNIYARSSHSLTNKHKQHISGRRGSNQADNLLAVIRLSRSTQLNQVSSFLVEHHEAMICKLASLWLAVRVVPVSGLLSLLNSTVTIIQV